MSQVCSTTVTVDTTLYQELMRTRLAEREAMWRLEWEWAEARLAARRRRAAAARARSAQRWADDATRQLQASRRASFRLVAGERSE